MEDQKCYIFKAITNKWNEKYLKNEKYIKFRKKNKHKMKTKKSPYPFVKWAGGKRQLISQMKKFFPNNFNNYIEPFVGGGAVFFHLFKNNRIKNKVILIDINKDLINCYKVIKNDVESLIEELMIHEKDKMNKKYYYKIRSLDRDPIEYNKLSNVEKAARIIYMNRVCFNGLYRVNSKGQFNVPFGRYKNPTVCDQENLRVVSKALKNVVLVHGSYEECLNYIEKNDFIYLDPPYHPKSGSSSFTSYTKEDFQKQSQIELHKLFQKLSKKKCFLMLSNSYTDFIKDLYKDYILKTLKAKRAINSDAEKRGKIKEILILNYDMHKSHKKCI